MLQVLILTLQMLLTIQEPQPQDVIWSMAYADCTINQTEYSCKVVEMKDAEK